MYNATEFRRQIACSDTEKYLIPFDVKHAPNTQSWTEIQPIVDSTHY